MKKVLYIGPSFYGYETIIVKLIEQVLNYEVIYIDLGKFHYFYKNVYEKIVNNIYYKKLKKEDLRDIKKVEKIITELNKINLEKIDIIFYIKPLESHIRLIKYLKKLNKEMICHQWDSLKSLDGKKNYFKYFDKISSFDFMDCKKYNMKFIPNFYFFKTTPEEKCEYDAFTIITYDYRFSQLEALAKELKKLNVNYKFLVYTKGKNVKSEYVTLIEQPISLNETFKYMKKSKVVVEIGHVGKQGGLSFRAIESLGLQKKLITNYTFIKDYDFYDENNIFVLENDKYDVPLEFFKTPYKKLSKEIYEKYSGEAWIKNIFL